ncbi:MAG TPA: hypothetical protein PLN33_17015 [Hyphomonadaceae bacterium]|nr:hypothetical protein [Hyphomonadaceae bacterium]HPN05120.1 hypothetical protein [Hyphomonadaceae bacterium]
MQPMWTDIVQAGVGVLGLIGLILTLVFARRAWAESKRAAKAAEEAVNVSRDIGRAQTRAYLSIADAKAQRIIVLNDDLETFSAGILATLKIANSGQSPAREIVATVSYSCMKDSDEGWDTERLARRVEFLALAANTTSESIIAFPIPAWEDTDIGSINHAEIDLTLTWTDVFEAKQSLDFSGAASWKPDTQDDAVQAIGPYGAKSVAISLTINPDSLLSETRA